MLSFAWYFMLDKGWILVRSLRCPAHLNVPITLAGIFAIHRTVGGAACDDGQDDLRVGDIPPPPTYPRQDLLIVGASNAEAADWFRDHLSHRAAGS